MLINKNTVLRGNLEFIHKKALRHTFNDIFKLEDENKKRMEDTDITVSYEEVLEYYNNLIEGYPDVQDELTIENISWMIVREFGKLKKCNTLTDRTNILLHGCKIVNYQILANYILHEIMGAKYIYQAYYEAHRTIYDFSQNYKLNDENVIKYRETLDEGLRSRLEAFYNDTSRTMVRKNRVVFERILDIKK